MDSASEGTAAAGAGAAAAAAPSGGGAEGAQKHDAHLGAEGGAAKGAMLSEEAAVAIFVAKHSHTTRDSLSCKLAQQYGITSKSVRGAFSQATCCPPERGGFRLTAGAGGGVHGRHLEFAHLGVGDAAALESGRQATLPQFSSVPSLPSTRCEYVEADRWLNNASFCPHTRIVLRAAASRLCTAHTLAKNRPSSSYVSWRRRTIHRGGM